MKHIAVALLSGILFGAGLTVSQMINPQKVLGFLDIAAIPSGRWDPTLLFVFAGALPVMFAAYAVQRRMQRPLLAPVFAIPQNRVIDLPLILGAATFGVGWGLAGICPGPALTSLPLAGQAASSFGLFTIALLVGVLASWPLRRLIAEEHKKAG